MKVFGLVLVVGFLGIGSSQAQRVHGGFYIVTDGGGVGGNEEFFYFSQGRFLYHNLTDTGFYYGNGTFQIKADSLFLHFDPSQAPITGVFPDSAFRADKLPANNLTVRVMNTATKELLHFAYVIIEGERQINYTNEKGLARLVAPIQGGGQLRVSCTGYKEVRAKVDFSEGRHLLVKLEKHSDRITDDTRSFLIKGFAKRTILRDRWSRYRSTTPAGTRYGLAMYEKLANGLFLPH